MLTVTYAECRAKTPYAECRYAECRGAVRMSQDIFVNNSPDFEI